MQRLLLFLFAALALISSARADGPVFFGGNPVISAPLTINPTPGTTNQGLVITQTGVGGSSAFTGVNGSGFAYDLINIPSDQIQQTGTSPLTYGLQVYMQPNADRGQKSAFSANINRTGASLDTGAGDVRDTIAATFLAQSNVPNNGTNTGAGAAGTLFGMNPGVNANSGATNLFLVSGGEVDVAINTGASSRYRFGLGVVDNGNLQAADAIYDAAFSIGAAGGPGFKNGLLFSSLNGNAPLSAGACAICTDGQSVTIGRGIDLSSYTFTNTFIKGPNNYQVTPQGDTATRHVVGSQSTPTANSCTGFTLSTGSTDLAGRVTFNSATSCAINFGTAFTNLPFCVVSPNATLSTIAVSASQTVLTMNFGTAQTVASYICMGN